MSCKGFTRLRSRHPSIARRPRVCRASLHPSASGILRLIGALAIGASALLRASDSDAVGSGPWYTDMPPGTAIVAPAPGGAGSVPLHDNYVVSIAGRNAPVYRARVGISYSYQWPGPAAQTEFVGFSTFDITGAVTATVSVRNQTVRTATILPANYGVTPTVSNNVVSIPIRHPGKYELQINGSESKVLYLFANPVDPNPPKPTDAGVRYYGPGVHTVGRLQISAGQTVYLAPGAIVRGQMTLNGSNARLRGRGILDNSGFATHDGNPVLVYGSNALIEGITILDSPGWSVSLWGASNAVVDNIKVFAYRQNSDGIDVVSNRGTVISNVFLRNWDDGIAIKAYGGDVADITVRDSIVANDFGWGALEIGAETAASSIGNVRFSNIDILHSHAYNAIDIQNSDQANIHDITYSDVRIHNHHGYSRSGYNGAWISMEIADNIWSSGTGRGSINAIQFRNVHFLTGQQLPSIMTGHDGTHLINGVRFSSLKRFGQGVRGPADLRLTTNGFVRNITYE